MSSGNAAVSRLSLLLVGLMVFPGLMTLGIYQIGADSLPNEAKMAPIDFTPDSDLPLGLPNSGDPSHGWKDDSGNIGEAALFYRTATYVPIEDWSSITGEVVMSGWLALAHEYPVPSDWRESLTDLGMECRTFYSPQGFHCKVPKLTPMELEDFGVIGAFRLDGTDKLAPDVISLVEGQSNGAIMQGDRFVMNVVLSGSDELSDLINTGVEVSDYRSNRIAEVVVSKDDLGNLLELDFVEWVEPKYPAQLDNQGAADIIDVDWVADASNMGIYGGSLTGAGVIVAVMDSGLDDAVVCSSISECNTLNNDIHADFAGRIRGIVSYTCSTCTDGPDDPNGHGTHVTGSVLGDGSNSPEGTDNSGMAPDAQLFMQAVYAVGGYCSGSRLCQPDYEDFFAEAHNAGARIHTNSWGTGPDSTSGCSGTECFAYYSSDAWEIDTEANVLSDLTILFAMGNDAMDCTYNSFGQTTCYGGKNGEINLGALNRQATAKNILSVGASENYRDTLPLYSTPYRNFCTFGGNPPAQGECPQPHTDEKWSMNPIFDDTASDNPEGMAAFSNRGPTSDGRIKPDIVAPGTWILSTRSSYADTNSRDVGDYYTHKYGTSMATPITAGSIALILEYLNNFGGYDCNLAYDPSSDLCPESSLIKAIVAAGAHDLMGQYETGGDANGNGAAEKAPNSHEGWGRVDLQGVVGTGFTEGIEISTEESHSFRLSIPDTGIESFRVVLSWNDPANSPGSGKQLINDLDILLKSPSGVVQTYTNDDVNNLVGITVDGSPEVGDWEIIVTGTNVPSGPQKYYLASSAGLIEDMRHPVSDGLNEPGFQSGSIFTETTMTVGGTHLCTILDDASLQCWGDNSYGQLGDGTKTDRLTTTPVNLDEGRTAVSISAGKEHTCAILDNGELVCWGRNNFGQLGDGSDSQSNNPTGVVFSSSSAVPVQVSSGDWHSCAVLDDASLECWGRNDHGQLGDGTNIDRNSAVQVSLSPHKVLAVSTGANHTCAVLDDWSLKCWGANGNGQLGLGSTTSTNSPATVSVGGNTVAVSAGGAHTCAILHGFNMKCWGMNSMGQLGDGGTNQQNDASSVGYVSSGSGDLEVTTIDAGESHTCAIDLSKALHCWGSSAKGQVGDGSTSSQISSPTTIDLGQSLGALSVSTGTSFTCVVASNDLPRCWGGHGSGDLSMDTSPSEFSIPRWSYISSSERDLNDPPDGTLNIFEVSVAGDSDSDGFPDADDNFPNNPTKAVNCSPGSYGRFTCRLAGLGYYVEGSGYTVMTPASPGHYVNSIGASSQVECPIGEFQELSAQTSCEPARPGYYVSDTGSAEGTPCPAGTYNNEEGQTSEAACNWAEAGHSVPVLTQVSSGAKHTCAILDDGSVSCWGENSNGQLGDGTRSVHIEPDKVSMPLGRKALEISAGSYHTCALLDDGSVRCWGANDFGQLGDGTTIERVSPVSVDLGGTAASGVSAGESHTCAILDDDSVKCWGDNSNGQLGDGTTTTRNTPVSVSFGGSGVHQISAGSYHTCSIMLDRTVNCWGDNWHGQLGLGSNSDSLTPRLVSVSSNSSAVTLDSGAFHTCLGMNDGKMYCWGYNSYGQLGNGGTTNSNSPIMVPLSSTQSPTSVLVGLFHSCSLFDSGDMACWGDNTEGQLGDGSQTGQLIPNLVSLSAGVLSISVGHRHSCAVLDDASLKCWGMNSMGQLGDGGTTDSATPASVDLGHGSREQVPCAPGTYQPNESQTSCILADRGFSVPLEGQLGQSGCTRGEYSSLKGQATCTLASVGFYVDGFEAQSQKQCPDGFSTLAEGSTNFDMCMPDYDGDLVPDQFDSDADNDGVVNSEDFDWLDESVSIDSDNDDIPDSIDTDDDNDGVNDTEDLFPYNQAEWKDADMDGIGDNSDTDDDGDGRDDKFDVFPDDPNEWSDFDGDNIGDNLDPDDDNDGLCDDPSSPGILPPDLDEDGTPDCIALPQGDAFPLDPSEWYDTDGDSIGNQNDTDDDNDGYNDSVDAFELDPTEWADSDNDNIGDNRDMFPNNSAEWQDTDSDGVGDNSDVCPYEFGINPSDSNMMTLLALPGNELGCPVVFLPGDEITVTETEGVSGEITTSDEIDTDGDGIPDLWDTDDDNDGILDINDGRNPDSGDPNSVGIYSKDPTRPFGLETWAIIVSAIFFVGLMGYRTMSWKRRGVSSIRSKRIRIQ